MCDTAEDLVEQVQRRPPGLLIGRLVVRETRHTDIAGVLQSFMAQDGVREIGTAPDAVVDACGVSTA